MPGAWDSFELLVRAVVGQQISVAGARTILGRIAARSAEIFPSAEEMVSLDLDGLGMTTRRVATLQAAAKAVASGEIDLEAGDPAETVAALVELPGIGPWTAGYVALRALRDPDAWPDDDLGLRRTMAALAIP